MYGCHNSILWTFSGIKDKTDRKRTANLYKRTGSAAAWSSGLFKRRSSSIVLFYHLRGNKRVPIMQLQRLNNSILYYYINLYYIRIYIFIHIRAPIFERAYKTWRYACTREM